MDAQGWRSRRAPRAVALKALEIIDSRNVGLLKHNARSPICAKTILRREIARPCLWGCQREAGRPPVPRLRQVGIATGVLRLMLKGRNLDAAALQVAKQEGIGGSQVRLYWAENKLNARVALRSERPLSSHPWKKEEAKRLEQLFAKDNRRLAKLLKQESDAPLKALAESRRNKPVNKPA